MAEPSPSLRRVHLVVDGRVQGVWFRETTRQQAERLGVAGWVRNLPDGRVEAVYEGAAGPVNRLLSWTHEGPDLAMVTHVVVEEQTPQGERGFRVR
jgi:acylphosphatase